MNELKFASLFARSPLLAVSIWIQRPLFRERPMKVGFPVFEENQRIGMEWLWCKRLGYDVFKVDNIPVLVRGIALGDIIHAGWSEAGWLFVERRIQSEFGTAWIVAEHLELEHVWPQLTDGLTIDFEFASPHRVAVAGSDSDLCLSEIEWKQTRCRNAK